MEHSFPFISINVSVASVLAENQNRRFNNLSNNYFYDK